MTGYRYTSTFAPAAITTAADIWEVKAPSDAAIKIWGWEVFQTSDLGDAAEEILALYTQWASSAGSSGSGGQTVYTTGTSRGVPATGATIEGLNGTVLTGGSVGRKSTHGWNIRVPLPFWYPPEFCPIISPGEFWLLTMPAPTDSLTVGATLYFEEIGG